MLDRLPTTEALAQFACDTGVIVPEEMRAVVRICLLDLVGIAAFAGVYAESSESFRAFTTLGIGDGPGTVIGADRTYAWPYAALLNGAYAHSLDFDDTNAPAALHPGAPVIPAALAQAERLGASGTALIDAIAIGYELCCRLGVALTPAGYDRGFHMTSVAGIFGAVAAAGRLAGVDAQMMEAAFGLALSRAGGSMQYLANGAWNKRLHPGFAAHDALVVLAMAQAGALGACEPIEGRYGLLHAYTERADPAGLTIGLGSDWIAIDTALKPYPSCRLTHGAIDAVLAVRDQVPADMRGEAVLRLRVSPTAVKITGTPDANKIVARNIVDGQFSIYFQAAVALLEGRMTWESYDLIGDPGIEALTRRMTVEAVQTMPPLGCALTIEWPGGLAESYVAEPLGETSRPIGWNEARAKFMGLAEPVYGAARADAIAHGIAAADGSNARTLIASFRG